MATGFIYVVGSVAKDYAQKTFRNVPTYWVDRLYIGPCKESMRQRMDHGDYVFGVSPASPRPRRILFVARIEERITFGDAYHRFPNLHGPKGPIHVRPIDGTGSFPQSSYQHIPGSMHESNWKRDLASKQLDRFFVCSQSTGWRGSWLGPCGPEIDEQLLALFKACSVHGSAGFLGQNMDATLVAPIAHRGPKGLLWRGLHLETDKPEDLVAICEARMTSEAFDEKAARAEMPRPTSRTRSRCDVPRQRQPERPSRRY